MEALLLQLAIYLLYFFPICQASCLFEVIELDRVYIISVDWECYCFLLDGISSCSIHWEGVLTYTIEVSLAESGLGEGVRPRWLLKSWWCQRTILNSMASQRNTCKFVVVVINSTVRSRRTIGFIIRTWIFSLWFLPLILFLNIVSVIKSSYKRIFRPWSSMARLFAVKACLQGLSTKSFVQASWLWSPLLEKMTLLVWFRQSII